MNRVKRICISNHKSNSPFWRDFDNLIKQGHSRKEAFKIANANSGRTKNHHRLSNRVKKTKRDFYDDIDSSDHLFDHYNTHSWNTSLILRFIFTIIAFIILGVFLIMYLHYPWSIIAMIITLLILGYILIQMYAGD